jgi:RNA polymerase sigma factor (sigma-70 family)
MRNPRLQPLRGVEERNALVVQWTGLPSAVARKTFRYFLDLEEANNAGMLGLIRAAEVWDEKRGVLFKTYAWDWIRRSIQDADQLAAPVRIPQDTMFRRRPHRHRAEALRVIGFTELPEQLHDHRHREEEPRDDYRIDLVRDLMKELLNPAEQQVLCLHCMEGLPHREVGKRLGYCKEWTRKIYNTAVRKIRDEIKYRQLVGE